jgi:hypothetical protein
VWAVIPTLEIVHMVAHAHCFTPAQERQLHEKFLSMLPQIRNRAEFALRGLRRQLRDELIDEIVADTFVWFRRLAERGRLERAFATPLFAEFCPAAAWAARSIATMFRAFTASDRTASAFYASIATTRVNIAGGQFLLKIEMLDRRKSRRRKSTLRIGLAGCLAGTGESPRGWLSAIARAMSPSVSD